MVALAGAAEIFSAIGERDAVRAGAAEGQGGLDGGLHLAGRAGADGVANGDFMTTDLIELARQHADLVRALEVEPEDPVSVDPGPVLHLRARPVAERRLFGPDDLETMKQVRSAFDGEATFITGGTMIGGKVSRPNQQLGTDIQGGQTHHLVKGDVITIAAGTPHWFTNIEGQITEFSLHLPVN